MESLLVTDFKGFRNDKGLKFIPPNYMYSLQNFNFNHIIGLDKIFFPEVKYNGGDTDNINGFYRFRYLDELNVLRTEDIFIKDKRIYKNFDMPFFLKSTNFDSKFTFTVLNNKLFFANGKDYPYVYDGKVITQMGAPSVIQSGEYGALNGAYYYAMTYKIGSEQITGTISNTVTVSNYKITVNIPLGPTGTTERKIYRTESNGGVLKLLTTISDNTTLTLTDNALDGTLGAILGDINNECPKPYFIATLYEHLIGCVLDDYPTSLYVGDPSIEFWNGAIFEDISNIDGDNTRLKGMSRDYDKIIIGSEKNLYILDASGTTPTITATRSNVGVKNGYSMVTIPSDGDFTGGVFFVSMLNDVRLFNGNFSQAPVATSLDNLRTDNWTEEIQNTFISDIKNASDFAAAFYDYKYHLLIGNSAYVFDIRLQAWTYYRIATATYTPSFNCIAVLDDVLYSGQKSASIIEKWYIDDQYRGEDPLCIIKSPQYLYSEKYKWFDSIDILFDLSKINKWKITIITDGDYNNKIIVDKTFVGASFYSGSFDPAHFDASEDMEDFRTIFIQRYARFIEFEIEIDDSFFYFRGFKINYNEVNNKEGLAA